MHVAIGALSIQLDIHFLFLSVVIFISSIGELLVYLSPIRLTEPYRTVVVLVCLCLVTSPLSRLSTIACYSH